MDTPHPDSAPSRGLPAISGFSPAGTAFGATVAVADPKSAPRAVSISSSSPIPRPMTNSLWSFPPITTHVRSVSGTTRAVRPPTSTSSSPGTSCGGAAMLAEPELLPTKRTGPSKVSARSGSPYSVARAGS